MAKQYGPTDPQVLATMVANCLVLAADPQAVVANAYYHHRLQPALLRIAELLNTCPDTELQQAATELQNRPADPAAYRRLIAMLAKTSGPTKQGLERIGAIAWQTLAASRLDVWVGDRYQAQPPAADAAAGADAATATAVGSSLTRDLLGIARNWPTAAEKHSETGSDSEVLVVVPFRSQEQNGLRLRNLVACLLSLNDQSLERDTYRVCVVESDQVCRWQQLLTPLVDDYLFAPDAEDFNKCWAVNVGVRNSRGPADLICVLDADALVDREFVRRNLDRFRQTGIGGFLPFRTVTYLDEVSSVLASHSRCVAAQPDLDRAQLRGFLVHRAPGMCVWMRGEVFDAVHGMDERYRGWGREDLDFALRLQLATPFMTYEDPMYHLHHPSSARLENGQTGNARLPLLTWNPTGPIGVVGSVGSTPEWPPTIGVPGR